MMAIRVSAPILPLRSASVPAASIPKVGLLAIGLLTGCVAPAPPPAPPPVAAAPQPRPVVPPASPPAPTPADWRDAPQTPGTWRWALVAGRSTASYAAPGQPPVAALACDAGTRTTILWTSSPAAGPAPLVVTTTGLRRVLTASPIASGGTAVSLSAADPLLDAMAFSRGRFMLEFGGSAPLYLPAWPELSRVIEDCRQG